MSGISRHLKPTDREILELAALPSCLLRLLRGLRARDVGGPE